jgi:hypothetical protein
VLLRCHTTVSAFGHSSDGGGVSCWPGVLAPASSASVKHGKKARVRPGFVVLLHILWPWLAVFKPVAGLVGLGPRLARDDRSDPITRLCGCDRLIVDAYTTIYCIAVNAPTGRIN